MAERHQNPAAETIPGTPVIRKVRTGSGSENFNPVRTRRGGVRAEIYISSPLFGGRGSSWVPFNLEDNFEGVGEFDIKRMKEQTVELEKDLIMKELETLDFLEALASTKSIVEDLKRQLQQQALRRRGETPEHLRSHIKEMVYERGHHNPQKSLELKQASINLGKTMDNLVLIHSYAESLDMKTKEEKDFLGAASLAEELNSLKFKPPGPDQRERFNTMNLPVNPQCEQIKMVVETNDIGFHKQRKTCLKTAEMRLVAARKMEDAARAAEALAIAEITILSSGKNQDALCYPEPPSFPLTLKAHMNKELSTNVSRIEILRKLEEANEEVKQSTQALKIALNRVEIASVKQLEAEDAFRQWNIESWKDQKAIGAKRSVKRDSFPQRSFLSHVNQHEPLLDLPEPMLKRNVSMGNVLNRKQVPTIDEKQLVTPRRRFRFIHTHQASIGETE